MERRAAPTRALGVVWPVLRALLAGIVLGAVVGALGGPLIGGSPFLAGGREDPEARAFVLGLLHRDPEAQFLLRPQVDVASRALQLKNSELSQPTWSPESMTYLGGGGVGPLSVDLYVVGIHRLTDGTRAVVPLTVTVLDHKVVNVR